MLPCGFNEWSFFLQLWNESAKGGISDPWSWGRSWGGTVHRVSPINCYPITGHIPPILVYNVNIKLQVSPFFQGRQPLGVKHKSEFQIHRMTSIKRWETQSLPPSSAPGESITAPVQPRQVQRKPLGKMTVLTGPHTLFLQLGHPFGSRLNRFMAP